MNRVAVCGVWGVSACLAIGALAGLPASAAAPDEPMLKYRGAGSSRSALDAMQLKPFDQTLWSNLSNWSGTQPKAEDMTGKVVLVVTWANWYKISHGAMKTAQTMSDQYAAKGLVVVGVNNKNKPEGAADKAKELGITFPIADDKDNKFHTALKADQDPNIYFIDRAGNLRYAQIDTSSINEAAAHLVAETADEAADFPKSLERKRVSDDAAKWKTREAGGIRPGAEPPTVSFPEPEEEAYNKVKWPYMVGKVETDAILNTTKNEAPKIANWPEEDWVPAVPKKSGKLVLLYMVDPQRIDMLDVIPTMNRLYDKYHRDVVVVCSLYKIGSGGLGNAGNNNGSGGDGEDKVKTRNKELLPSLMRTRNPNHYINPTPLKTDNLDMNNTAHNFIWNGKMEDYGIAVILSTDMKMRWLGNSHDGNLSIALDKILEVDPAVRARRKAEAAKK